MRISLTLALGLLLTFTSTFASTPTPKIFVLDDSGTLISAPGSMGVMPYQIHLSALPELPKANCYWDPTLWRAAGEKNICSDGAPYSVKNLPASDVSKYFNTDPSKFTNPQNVEGGIPSACFETYGLTLDALSNELVNQMAQCIHNRDEAFNQSVSSAYLGGGNLLKSTFNWDFGDPGSAFNQVKGFNAAHVYSTTGSRTITLTVINESGLVGVAHYTVNVQPDNRVPLLLNSDADLAKLNISNGPAQGRHIVFKSGVTFHIPGTIALFTNDWVSSSGTQNAILANQTSSTLFTPHGSSHVLVENLMLQGNGGGWVATGYGNNHAFKNLAFSHFGGGFQPGNFGVLIQNTGMPKGPDGSWQSNHLKANFIIHGVKGLSLYGNHVYLEKADWNAEPAVRSNGGHFLSFIGNEIGGYTGKNDQVSVRGAKYIYFGSNEMRGGVFNIQFGVSPNPQPGAMPNALIMENNILENLGFETSGSVSNVLIRNNLFHIHGDAETAYNLLYPRPNPHNITVNGGAVGTINVKTNNIRIEGNAIQLDQNAGTPIVFYGQSQFFQLVGNKFLSPLVPALRLNGSLEGVSAVEKNSYYMNSGVQIADLGLKSDTLLHWNSNVLSNGSKVNDLSLDVPAKAPLKSGELAIPTPTPAPTPVPTATPTPVTKTIQIHCSSWNYKPALCATGIQAKTISVLKDDTGSLCKPGNFSLSGNNISVINGCRGLFEVKGN